VGAAQAQRVHGDDLVEGVLEHGSQVLEQLRIHRPGGGRPPAFTQDPLDQDSLSLALTVSV
jgi:hypothetical protein